MAATIAAGEAVNTTRIMDETVGKDPGNDQGNNDRPEAIDMTKRYRVGDLTVVRINY